MAKNEPGIDDSNAEDKPVLKSKIKASDEKFIFKVPVIMHLWPTKDPSEVPDVEIKTPNGNITVKKGELNEKGLRQILFERKTVDEDINQIIDGLRQEYTEVCNNNRHYSNLRFAIFTVCFAVFGGLLSLLYSKDLNFFWQLKIVLVFGGGFVSYIFFLFEVYCSEYILVFISRARELETLLDYEQFCKRETTPRIPSRLLAKRVRWVFALQILFWIIQLVIFCFFPRFVETPILPISA